MLVANFSHLMSQRAVLPNDFLRELRSFLYNHYLNDSIAISTIPPSDKGLLMEHFLPDDSGTIAFRCKAEDDLEAQNDTVVTGWSFVEGKAA
jgi:hypothetical protein